MRYSTSEKKSILKKSLRYASRRKAARNLGVNQRTLKKWIEEYNFQEEILKKEAERRQKFLVVIKNSKTDFDASLKTGISVSAIHRLKKESGLVRRRCSDKEKKRIAEESLTYTTALEAAHNLGVPYHNLVVWRRKMGIYPKSNKVMRTRYSDEQKKLLAEESKKYQSITIAASNLGVTTATLTRYCKQFGVSIKRKRRSFSLKKKREAVNEIKNSNLTKVSRDLKIPLENLKFWLKLDAEGKL